MNTTDIKYSGQIESFNQLYKLAKDQFIEYERLEGISNWEDYDFSIDCASDQAKFKDMLQIRFIEELTEASCSIGENEEHFWEEMGDSLNFFLPAYIMLGVDFNNFDLPEKYLFKGIFDYSKTPPENIEEFSLKAYPLIEKVGYLCNLLKNRPWAESNFLVSMYDFNERLHDLWNYFWYFMGSFLLTKDDIFEMFYKKYMVNEWRRNTGY